MWQNIIITYFHFIAIFVMFSSLIVEMSLLKHEITRKDMRLILEADLLFGVFAGITAVSGLLRMFYFGKGIDYYLINPLFIIKLAAFLIVGLLSVFPTITFLKIRKLRKDVSVINHYGIIKLIIRIEFILLLFIPLFAVLVTNGFGI